MIYHEGLIYRPDIQNNNSFVNDLKTYEWPEFHDEEGKAYLTEAGWHGEPLPDDRVMFYYRQNPIKDKTIYHFSFVLPKYILQHDYRGLVETMIKREKRKLSSTIEN